ncbi:MAG: sigma-70 family RNA polymerase sigma factor [Ardenticatenaceae bacterium]
MISSRLLINQGEQGQEAQVARSANDAISEQMQGFFELWQEHQPYLYRCCLKWMGSQMHAEDALSEAMLKAADCWTAAPMINVRAWFSQLTYNHCIDLRRQSQRRSLDVALDEMEEEKIQLIAFGPLPAQVIEKKEMSLYVNWAIDLLPIQLHEVATLRFLSQWSYEEIASEVASSPATVRKQIQRARTQIAALTGGYLSDSADERLPSLSELSQEMAPEIKASVVAIRPVQVTLPSGVEISHHLSLHHYPARLEQKLNKLQKYVERYPSGWKKRLELADVLVGMGHIEQAVEQYQEVLVKRRSLINVYLKVGELLRLMGRTDTAIATFMRGLEVGRYSKEHLQGLIATCRGQYQAAMKEFEAATSKQPQHAAHWHAYGLTALTLAQPERALWAFDQALKLDANDLLALTHSCDALLALGQHQEAEERAQKALEIDKNNVLALLRQADARAKQGLLRKQEGTETRRLLRKARQLAPHAPDVADSQARYHILRSEQKKGLNLLRTFAHSHPNAPRAWCHYAHWLSYCGHAQAAKEAISKAYELHPNDVAIGRAYRQRHACLPQNGRIT